MTSFSLRSITVLGSVLLALVFGHAYGQEYGTITGVNLTPDGKKVVIRCDGQAGTHSAFVIERPYRLVIDFESTGLGRVARKIKVGRDPVEEIRLGNTGSRARVVVDFGDRPVPAFSIDRMNNVVMVTLDEGTVQAAQAAAPRPAVSRSAAQPTPVRASGAVAPKSRNTGLSVNKAGVSDSLVFVELADPRNPKGKYRLVVDLDTQGMMVRNATLSDATGALKRFDFVEGASESGAKANSTKIGSGPRGNDPALSSGGLVRPAAAKYKWGLASAQGSRPRGPEKSAGLPFQVEQYQLQAKKTDR